MSRADVERMALAGSKLELRGLYNGDHYDRNVFFSDKYEIIALKSFTSQKTVGHGSFTGEYTRHGQILEPEGKPKKGKGP